MAGLWRRLLELFRASRLDREADEELAYHLDMLVARNRDAGMDDVEARRQAHIEAGSVAAARDRIAEGRTGFPLEQAVREVRYAARILRRSPAVTLLSIITMGVGIGICALLFTLLDAIVLRPLPYPYADRLVSIFDTNLEAGIERTGAASGNIDDWRRATGFEGIAGFYATGRTLTKAGEAEVLITAQVSRDFFSILKVPAALGRTFTEEESRRAKFNNAAAPIGPASAVILSHVVWRQRFGADPRVIGRSVSIDRRPFTIVGVMPPVFAMPDRGVQLWIPWDISGDHPRDQHYLSAVGRLKPGVSIAQAEDELNTIAAQLAVAHPATNRGWRVRVSPLRTETVGDTATVLWILFAAVGLVLIVACASVALLSIMRGLDRAEEAAVRLALGASPGRLLREALVESALLASAGGALGVAVLLAGLRILPRLTTDLPRLEEVTLDARALLFIAAVTVLSAVLSGLPQAWRRTRLAPVNGLASGSLRTTGGARRHLVRDAIVVFQVALAMVLMAGSGLLVRSFLHLRGADPDSIHAACSSPRCFSTARRTTAARRRGPTTARCSSGWNQSLA